ncbi:DegT/DnrJ/EryC1/StrS family aminotransferase [Candidatus Margulisiibacteriota bacterium]
MKVPQFAPYIGEEEYAAIKSCFTDNWITEGPKAKEFNSMLCKLIGVKYGVFAPNGTLSIYLGLRAMGICSGDEVLVPDFTFIGSATAVEMAGATPVFVDVNKHNFQINSKACKKKLSKKTKAVMPVHIYGMSANMDEVMSFASENNLMVIEDAAQAIGVSYKGKHCGSFGKVSSFSFFADKTITTGEGGFVATNDKDVYENLLYLRNQGRLNRGSFIHPKIGYNFRMTDIQIAVGIVQLNKLPIIKEKKLLILEKYKKALAGIEQVAMITLEDGSTYVPFRIALICEKAHALMAFLEKNGVQSRSFFYPLHKQPCFQYLAAAQSLADKDFPHAVGGYDQGVCLPSFVSISDEQINYVCGAIKEFYQA